MKPRTWTVLIGDLRASREIPVRERPRVDSALKRSIAQVARRFEPHFRLLPQVLKGDEVQAVLRPGAPVLSMLTYLRALLTLGAERAPVLRAGLGQGGIARLSAEGPFASDGEAFHRAREALDRAKRGTSSQLTGWISGDAEFDEIAAVLLDLTDALWSRWTKAQWEAVAGRLEGKGLHDIGRATGVKFQNVSKRLRAASWNEAHRALLYLEQRAGRSTTAQGARGGHEARVHPETGEWRRSPRGG